MTYDDIMKKHEESQEMIEELQNKIEDLTSNLEDVEKRLSNRQEGCFILLTIFLVVILIKVW